MVDLLRLVERARLSHPPRVANGVLRASARSSCARAKERTSALPCERPDPVVLPLPTRSPRHESGRRALRIRSRHDETRFAHERTRRARDAAPLHAVDAGLARHETTRRDVRSRCKDHETANRRVRTRCEDHEAAQRRFRTRCKRGRKPKNRVLIRCERDRNAQRALFTACEGDRNRIRRVRTRCGRDMATRSCDRIT